MQLAWKKFGAFLGLALLALSFFAGETGVAIYSHHEATCADHHHGEKAEHCHDTEGGHEHAGDTDPVAHCHSCPASLVTRFETFLPNLSSLELSFADGSEVYRNPCLGKSLQPPRV